jgi:hypothetical protein
VENRYNYANPAVAMFSLGVQHEIMPALIWTTQYVGNLSWHQNVIVPIDNFPLSTSLATRQASAAGTLSTVATLNARTYPGFSGIMQENNEDTATYNGFQTGVRQQDRHGLSFEVNYTWSHEIDDQPSSTDVVTAGVMNPYNLKYYKGSGTLDRRHIFNANYTYKLPIFAHDTGFNHDMLGGWVLAGTMVKETGLPWAGNDAPTGNWSDSIGLGGGYRNMPSRAPGVPIVYPKTHGAHPQWVSNANGAFVQPCAPWAPSTTAAPCGPSDALGFGNMGRDAVIGPGRTNFNTSLYKTFAIRSAARIELRAESYNTFNHTQFAVGSASGGFNMNTNSGNFGQVTGAADPRTFQFGGKISF